jgi:hypothetical protein
MMISTNIEKLTLAIQTDNSRSYNWHGARSYIVNGQPFLLIFEVWEKSGDDPVSRYYRLEYTDRPTIAKAIEEWESETVLRFILDTIHVLRGRYRPWR